MRVHVTIDVSGVNGFAGVVPILANVRAAAASQCEPEHAFGIDRLGPRAGEASAFDAPLSRLAAARPHGAQRLVRHGTLHVPASAERCFETAVRYLRHDTVMRHVIERVEHAQTAYALRIVHNGDDRYDAGLRRISWDPHGALRTTEGGRQTPALGLGHELAHAAEPDWRRDAGQARYLRRYDDAEERRVIRGAEAHAARTLGEAARYDHRGTGYWVRSAVAC